MLNVFRDIQIRDVMLPKLYGTRQSLFDASLRQTYYTEGSFNCDTIEEVFDLYKSGEYYQYHIYNILVYCNHFGFRLLSFILNQSLDDFNFARFNEVRYNHEYVDTSCYVKIHGICAESIEQIYISGEITHGYSSNYSTRALDRANNSIYRVIDTSNLGFLPFKMEMKNYCLGLIDEEMLNLLKQDKVFELINELYYFKCHDTYLSISFIFSLKNGRWLSSNYMRHDYIVSYSLTAALDTCCRCIKDFIACQTEMLLDASV